MFKLLDKKETVLTPASVVYQDLMNPKKYSEFFPNTFLQLNDEPVPKNFDFVLKKIVYMYYVCVR